MLITTIAPDVPYLLICSVYSGSYNMCFNGKWHPAIISVNNDLVKTATEKGANAVIGVTYQFFNTSDISVFAFGSGTAVYIENIENYTFTSQQEAEKRAAQGDYKGRVYETLPDGRVRAQTSSGWMEFPSIDRMKSYFG